MLATILMLGNGAGIVAQSKTKRKKRKNTSQTTSPANRQSTLTSSDGSGNSAQIYGSLNLSMATKKVYDGPTPLVTYQIPMNPPDSVPNSREYLVVLGKESSYRGYILQYQTDFPNRNTLHHEVSFTGAKRLLDLQRTIKAESYFANGIVKSARSRLSTMPETSPEQSNEDGDTALLNILNSTSAITTSSVRCLCEIPSFRGEGWGLLDLEAERLPAVQPVDKEQTTQLVKMDFCHLLYPDTENTCMACGFGTMRNKMGLCANEVDALFSNIFDLDAPESNLTALQIAQLDLVFAQIYVIPIHRKFIYQLKKGLSYKVRINTDQKTSGGYDPRSQTISFRSEKDINYNVLLEELFHVFQDQLEGLEKFTNKATQYKGRSNIEFEAKLYADLTNLVNQQFLLADLEITFQFLGSNKPDYAEWLIELTDEFKTYPSWETLEADYLSRLRKFVAEKPGYAFPIDEAIKPKAMLKIFEQ